MRVNIKESVIRAKESLVKLKESPLIFAPYAFPPLLNNAFVKNVLLNNAGKGMDHVINGGIIGAGIGFGIGMAIGTAINYGDESPEAGAITGFLTAWGTVGCGLIGMAIGSAIK